MPAYKETLRSFAPVSRPGLLPKPVGRSGAGAISLGFDRHRGFLELACTRWRPPGPAIEYVSRDFGHSPHERPSYRPPARQERKIALLVFFLMLEHATVGVNDGLVEIGRGGRHSWCHSLYRLSVHNPKEGSGNKWLREMLGLGTERLDEPFEGMLRFIQCRRVGQSFIVQLDCTLFDAAAVTLSIWEKDAWQQSRGLRTEILYDLMRQVPRWAPLTPKLPRPRSGAGAGAEVELRGPWEDMPVYFRYVPAAKKVRLVGLNHQVFRRARVDWRAQHGFADGHGMPVVRDVAAFVAGESAAACEHRIAAEICASCVSEPFSLELEELSVFIGSPVAHETWRRNTGWHPEPYPAAEHFWRNYLDKIRQLRPRAKINLYAVDDVSPLVLHLEFPDGAAFLKWTPSMFGAYHPGNPGWNLLWNLGAPPPPHFVEIVGAMSELPKRAVALPAGKATGLSDSVQFSRVAW